MSEIKKIFCKMHIYFQFLTFKSNTLSNRQASSTVSVELAPSVTKLLECNANAFRVSAAALRVAQSELLRQP